MNRDGSSEASADPELSELGRLEARLTAERDLVDQLAGIAAIFTSERDPDRLMQRLTDEATRVVGAQFGAFFYNVVAANGEAFMLYTLSGAPLEAFERLGKPRNTAVFAPTFAGEGVVRSDDITRDPRYGQNPPFAGMPPGHLPVVSYLSVPVRSTGGPVLGALLFGHPAVGVFKEREERAVTALASMAAAALENARVVRSLEQANARYRLVNEASRDGIWYWDVATNSVEWNDALLATMGIARATWGGTFVDWLERVHPEDRAPVEAALGAHLSTRAPYRIELFRLRHTSGEYRWFTTVGQAEWDDEGRPLRMAGSVRDVTEAKLAEEARRAREYRNAQILDSVRDMIFCKDETLQLVFANAATCEFFGTKADELRKTEATYSQSEFNEYYVSDDREVFRSGHVVERQEEPVRSPTGQIRYFHTMKSPIFDAEGRVVELVGVSRDVTDRKRAVETERKLAEASAILSASIDYEETLANVVRAMVPLLADWCAVDLVQNGKLRRLSVAHSDPSKVALAYEIEARYPTRLDATAGVPKVIRTGLVEHIARIPDELLAAVTEDAEHLALARALGLSSCIIVPLKVHRRVVGTLSLVTEGERSLDESDIAIAEELARRVSSAFENALLYSEVRELNGTLEARVAERTSALVEANTELESFSYTVSHDLRAPIRHISGFAALLRSHMGDALDAKGSHFLETIQTASVRMGALIEALLNFSRLGRTELTKQHVELSELVQSVIQELALETSGREIDWAVGPLPSVEADPMMMRLVLTNLISNAVKYSRRTPLARVEIGSEVSPDEAIVYVRDNGAGFDMTYGSKLFGVFQRLHADDDFEGTGIGLATTRRVIHRHGGRVWAEGAIGRGATFYFALPEIGMSRT